MDRLTFIVVCGVGALFLSVLGYAIWFECNYKCTSYGPSKECMGFHYIYNSDGSLQTMIPYTYDCTECLHYEER